MNKDEYLQIKSLPLNIKVLKTKQRIREFVDYFGETDVYISFSGGKDSTVLLDLVWSMYPNIPAVFCNTGVEFPEIVQFVKWVQTFSPVEIVRPNMSFKQVLQKYGYPVVSKEQASYIRQYRHSNSEKLRLQRWNGREKDGHYKISEKWKYLTDAPFEISETCCDALKKRPMHKYERESGKYAILGTTAAESSIRLNRYLVTGCNSFEAKNPKSQPLSFWTDQDILHYIEDRHIPICSVYGDVAEKDGKLQTTGETRTGCVFCAFGAHLEKYPNRYQRLHETHPKLWKACMDQFGFRDVLNYINVPIEPNETKDKTA